MKVVQMSEFFLDLPPGLIIVLGALLALLLPKGGRRAVWVVLPLLALARLWLLPVSGDVSWSIAGFTLQPFILHDYTKIFATAFAIAASAGVLFGYAHAKSHELCAALVYAGSAIGVTTAGDLITLFIYWELMAIGSTLVILASDSERAYRSAMRYIAVHLLGGVVLMAGIALCVYITGDATIRHLVTPGEGVSLGSYFAIAKLLMLVGILVNAAAPPFSSWLADSYPEASPFGTVFLSAFTTKTAVFVLLTMFAGHTWLIPIGLVMVFYGIVMAILENDMRRILAYSIINQVGFMITAIGMGTQLALYGAAAHAFTHIIYKALLLMSAGSVLFMTGKRLCTQLGGLYHSMKLTAVCGIIGALAISAFPLTSGFVSKSLVTQAAANEHLAVVWFLLVAASAGVFLHAGIKFPWFVFFQKDSGMRPEDPPWNMKAAMILFSLLCIVPAIPGMASKLLYSMLPGEVVYEPYSYTHVVTQLQLLLFSGLAFFVMLPLLKRTETISLDFDWFYRRLGACIVNVVMKVIGYGCGLWLSLWKKLRVSGHSLVFVLHGPEGAIASNKPMGVTVLLLLALLAFYVVIYL
jgi:multicomponent Na+:H+ antiporter subunit D